MFGQSFISNCTVELRSAIGVSVDKGPRRDQNRFEILIGQVAFPSRHEYRTASIIRCLPQRENTVARLILDVQGEA